MADTRRKRVRFEKLKRRYKQRVQKLLAKAKRGGQKPHLRKGNHYLDENETG